MHLAKIDFIFCIMQILIVLTWCLYLLILREGKLKKRIARIKPGDCQLCDIFSRYTGRCYFGHTHRYYPTRNCLLRVKLYLVWFSVCWPMCNQFCFLVAVIISSQIWLLFPPKSQAAPTMAQH